MIRALVDAYSENALGPVCDSELARQQAGESAKSKTPPFGGVLICLLYFYYSELDLNKWRVLARFLRRAKLSFILGCGRDVVWECYDSFASRHWFPQADSEE
jgi:hypothetical protein